MSSKPESAQQSKVQVLTSDEKGKQKDRREPIPSTTPKRTNNSSKASLPLSQKYAFKRKHSTESDENEAKPPSHLVHRARLKELFPEGWNPPRKLSRDAMEGLRALHRLDSEQFSTPVLATRFKISPEAVRRILRSRWQPNKTERARLVEREKKGRQEAEQKRIERAKERAKEERELLKDMLQEGKEGNEAPRRREKDRLTLV
jgi:hypothetical protein